ncbi:hypothetical protein [Moorena sp. SIO3H5]|uniref:hypothetical protein n=1 Tax=Moorena sp. SIO3H5 TaxID=2607834 RepID=UPI0013BB8A37|nr:hypothetical protein [Moorena sp. SIO3H5]NEO74061.1 hypothetical protein [Moorena sp. SIO3H5]
MLTDHDTKNSSDILTLFPVPFFYEYYVYISNQHVIAFIIAISYTELFPYSLFPIPYSLFPIPCSLFPVP